MLLFYRNIIKEFVIMRIVLHKIKHSGLQIERASKICKFSVNKII